MKILCVYYNEEPSPFNSDPREILADHEVTCVHDFDSAVKQIRNSCAEGIPYDIVMSDVIMPGNVGGPMRIGGPILVIHTDDNGVSATGLFLRPELTEASFYEDPIKKDVFLATNACWTITGERDWAKLLSMLLFRLERVDVHLT